MTENRTGRPLRRSPVPMFWLIAKHENGQVEMLTIDTGGEGTLPVFSFAEEAEAFLSLGAPGTGWQAKETTAGELVSVLYGPCVGARRVALDPLPEVGGEAMIGLVCLSRERFVRNLIGEHGLSDPCQNLLRMGGP